MNKNIAPLSTRARNSSMNRFRLLQITDCHLGSSPRETLLGMDTDQSFYDVLATAQAAEQPDMIICTGDISNDAGALSYARFLSMMEDYFPDVPLAWLPGNHDDPDNMLVVGRHPISHSHCVNGWQMIMLDSRIPREEGGRLGPNELARLKRLLDAHPDMPTAIFLHHQPVPVGCKWLDQYVVSDADAFFELVDQYQQVKMISWGHVHQEFYRERNGVALIGTPSTCIQFLPNSDEFKLDTRMPGYRNYVLNEDGSFESEVRRSEAKAYAVDMTATGY
ncbi:3',5'-cyclic-AMP phosphodiesterase [Agaribacterium haliotis]|uniref:3',5'-cyclic-AMP phosphodiesterase n=1 Tax=Agaribacterium haliotis TaxID=2013869 RepID=UPI001EFE6695|nr:3',5'-cyclic-AMP phosphodiesterase [Agaribacterium haliotis]